jgi:hypothetical protein
MKKPQHSVGAFFENIFFKFSNAYDTTIPLQGLYATTTEYLKLFVSLVLQRCGQNRF